MSLLTRTDQKFLSFALSSLWKLMPGLAGLSCRSKAVVLTAFCSSPASRARLSVNVSAMRNSIGSDSPFEGWHRANHEFVKQRHRKSHVSMRWAIDHAFADQFRSDRADAGNLYVQSVCYIAGALRAWPQLSHCPQKGLLARREPIETDAEEILVQSRDDRRGRLFDDPQRDNACRGEVPSLVSPFLKKIRVPLR